MTLTFPANFMLIAAHESVPLRLSTAIPRASAAARARRSQRYLGKISGPLLDRIDLHIEVPAVPYPGTAREGTTGVASAQMRDRVLAARAIQSRARLIER